MSQHRLNGYLDELCDLEAISEKLQVIERGELTVGGLPVFLSCLEGADLVEFSVALGTPFEGGHESRLHRVLLEREFDAIPGEPIVRFGLAQDGQVFALFSEPMDSFESALELRDFLQEIVQIVTEDWEEICTTTLVYEAAQEMRDEVQGDEGDQTTGTRAELAQAAVAPPLGMVQYG